MLTVQYKDTTSEDLGLICVDVGRRQGAEEQLETYSIPYRDDEPTVHTDTFLPYLRPMVFASKNAANFKNIAKWLQGYGKLRTSKDPGGYFKANVISQRPVSRHSLNYDYIQVVFKINPGFFFLDSGDTPIPIGAPGTITNIGTHTAKPYMKITGSGNIDITINGRMFSLIGIVEYIELDSETEYAYRATANAGDKMEGDFPYFDAGDNLISWVGIVTNIQIIPRWREK